MGGLKGFFKNPAKAIKGTGRWLDEQSGGAKKQDLAQGPDSIACKTVASLCENTFNDNLASQSAGSSESNASVAWGAFVGARVCNHASKVCAVPKK